MNRRVEKPQFPMVGGSSLLVIFAVLCLTVFALLGLSTVLADKRLADVGVESVSDYYAADSEAEEILARLRSGEIPDNVTLEDNVYYYSCTVSPTLSLQVEVSAGDWMVLRWQTVSTVSWQADDSLELWSEEG